MICVSNIVRYLFIVYESVSEKPGFHLFFEKVYNLPREFEKATLKLLMETDL